MSHKEVIDIELKENDPMKMFDFKVDATKKQHQKRQLDLKLLKEDHKIQALIEKQQKHKDRFFGQCKIKQPQERVTVDDIKNDDEICDEFSKKTKSSCLL